MTPKRLITTWICDATHSAYRERDKQQFYKCLESWHRLMPDYDIRIVSEANILDYGSDGWIREQLRVGNGIGASQWARLHWLHAIGGIYVDMDVEAVQRFDGLLDDTFFVAHEGADNYANNAVMGAPAGHPFLARQLETLRHLDVTDPQFGNNSGPRMVTRLLREAGWQNRDTLAVLPDQAITVYPHTLCYPYFWRERFTPSCIKADTVAVHLWASSWDQHNPSTPEWARA